MIKNLYRVRVVGDEVVVTGDVGEFMTILSRDMTYQ